MAMRALRVEEEDRMEERERLARLESGAEYVNQTLSEMRVDMKSGFSGLNKRVDDVKDSIAGVKDSVASAKVWAIVLYVGMGVGLLTLIARAFKWV